MEQVASSRAIITAKKSRRQKALRQQRLHDPVIKPGEKIIRGMVFGMTIIDSTVTAGLHFFFFSIRTAAQGVTVKAMISEKSMAADEPMGIGRM